MRPFPRSTPAYPPLFAFVSVALAASLLSPPARAAERRIHPGLKAGVSISNLAGELHDLAGLESRTKPTFGGFVRFDVAPSFAIVPEVQYVQKGAKVQGTATDADGNQVGTIEASYQLHYLEIPVLVEYRFATGGRVAPNVYVAPTVAFATTRKFVMDTSTGVLGGSADIDLKDDVRNTDFLAAMGAGLDIGAGSGAVTLDVRYELGLREIFDATGAADDKNRTLLFTLGYSF